MATLEFGDIAAGIQVTDALIKKAPISLLKCGTISRGRYLAIIAGSTASVAESYEEGLFRGEDRLLDHAFLPDIEERLYRAVFGARGPCGDGAVGVLETDTASCHIRAVERALKGASIELVELRIADSLLHGKGVSIVCGELHDVQAAMDLAVASLQTQPDGYAHRIITSPHESLTAQLSRGTAFAAAEPMNLNGEIP